VAETLDASGFDARLRASDVMAELKKVRNVKPGFKKGLWFGMANAAWETATGGASPWTLKNKADWSSLH
jgi:electron-transferring-flavoprotein dehydrogenase